MKPNKKTEQEAQDLMKANDYPELIVNNKGEFFTKMGLALMSVEDKKANLITLKREVQSIDPDEAPKKELEAKLEKSKTTLTKFTNKLKEFDAFSTEGKTQEQIDNNKAAKEKLENKIKDLKTEVEGLSNELKSE